MSNFGSWVPLDHFKDENQEENIPEVPGIYAWYYNFEYITKISDKHKIVDKLVDVSKKLMYPEISGTLQGILGIEYQAVVKNIDSMSADKITEIIKNCDIDDLKFLIESLKQHAAPLYLGITQSQTLKDRYLQHKQNYNNALKIRDDIIEFDALKNTFGKRLCEMEIPIREVTFMYKKYQGNNIEKLEYILNRLFKPIAGRR